MPPEGVCKRSHDEILSFEEILRFVRALKAEFGLTKVHLTGGEPLLRSGLTELIRMLAAEGLPDLALTTNGQLLPATAAPLRGAGLTRLNISLDSLDEDVYRRTSRGGELAGVLAGVESALAAGLAPVKFNTVVLRGYNDGEVVSLARFALEWGCAIRFLELMPIGCAASSFDQLFVPAEEVRARLAKVFSLAPRAVRTGQSSRNFLAADSQGRRGTIGFIAPETQPFCLGCSRMRLTSTGQIIACLARGESQDVRELLCDDSPAAGRALAAAVAGELGNKRTGAGFLSSRPMVSVGG